MSRSRFAALAAVPVVVATGCAGSHSAVASHAQPGVATSFKTLTVTATPGGGSGVDNTPKGPSVGDQYFEHGTLKSADMTRVGTYVLVTQLVAGDANQGQEQQSITLHLSDGDLTTAGGIATADSYTVPVVGGSGAYAGARGEMSARSAPHDTETLTVRWEN